MDFLKCPYNTEYFRSCLESLLMLYSFIYTAIANKANCLILVLNGEVKRRPLFLKTNFIFSLPFSLFSLLWLACTHSKTKRF